jgi:hypothetical protein
MIMFKCLSIMTSKLSPITVGFGKSSRVSLSFYIEFSQTSWIVRRDIYSP